MLSVLGRRGYSIPNDISVVAFDDSEWLSTWHPSITAVDIVIDDLAQLAVDLLLQKIGAGTAQRKPMTYLLSTSIVERESCRDVGEHGPENMARPGARAGESMEAASPTFGRPYSESTV